MTGLLQVVLNVKHADPWQTYDRKEMSRIPLTTSRLRSRTRIAFPYISSVWSLLASTWKIAEICYNF